MRHNNSQHRREKNWLILSQLDESLGTYFIIKQRDSESDLSVFVVDMKIVILMKLDAGFITHHADAFLQYAPHTEVVSGDHLSRQGFPGERYKNYVN